MPRRARLALSGAFAGLLLAVLTWYAALHVGAVARADAHVLDGFAGLHGPFVDWLANQIAHLADPKPFTVFSGVIVSVALARRRYRVAGATAFVLLGANVTTQLLKSALTASHPVVVHAAGFLDIQGSTWPSGHATASMSLALCAVLVTAAPARPRVAAAGAAFSVAVCFSFLTLMWHYPSDVLGGFLVAGTWTLLGVAAVWIADARWPRPGWRAEPAPLSTRQALGPPLAAVFGALALLGLVVLARPHSVISYAHAHELFVLGAGAIGAFGMALATGLAVATTARGGRGGRGRDGAAGPVTGAGWPDPRPLSDSGPAPRAALPRR